jgi:pimeloyl-ACP methyl ester carboxylesterase
MILKRKKARRDLSPAAAGVIALGSAAAGLVTGWIVYSNVGIDHHVPLSPALLATREEFAAPGVGQLNVYEDTTGQGTPLVLIHSINAAASAYEMRPLFRYYRGKRPVYALDLPGYGFSERSNRVYSPDLFTHAILALLKRIEQPVDLVALSLSSEFAGQVARQAPDHVRSLTMISPTGFHAESQGVDQQVNGRRGTKMHRFLTFRLWARPLYDLLATRRSIKFFLQKSFAGAVPEDFVAYAYATAHQPGAEYAPFTFLSGMLFTPRVRLRVYDNLELPVLVIYDQDAYTNFNMLGHYIALHPNWQARRISPTFGLPHFEKLADTTRALDQFWNGL